MRERVHFAGHVAQPAALIKALDVFAMSSDTEQMPISLLEAMAAGLPAAATDVGDIAAMLPEAQQELVVRARRCRARAARSRTLLERSQAAAGSARRRNRRQGRDANTTKVRCSGAGRALLGN